MDVRRVNVGEIEAWNTCPEYHRNLWIRRRQLISETSESLALGIWAHRALEKMMNGAAAPSEAPPLKGAEGLLAALQLWHTKYNPPPWRVVATEVPLERQLDNIVLFGTPDALVEMDGKLWHVQHKTLSASMPVHVFVAGIAVSLHEAVYAWLVDGSSLVPNRPYGGTLVNVIRKLSTKRVEAEPSSALHLECVPITAERIEGALQDVLYVVERMADEHTQRKRNSAGGCTGRYGNKLCQFYDSCWRGISLDSPLYETSNPLARYGRPSEGEGVDG